MHIIVLGKSDLNIEVTIFSETNFLLFCYGKLFGTEYFTKGHRNGEVTANGGSTTITRYF